MYLVALLISLGPFVYSAFVSEIISRKVFFLGLACVPLFLQAWLPPVALAWNIPAWSLSVEAFFYAIFPFALEKCRWVDARKTVGICLLSVLGVSLLRQLVCPSAEAGWEALESGSDAWHRFYTYFPIMHLPKFLLGMALAKLFSSWRRAETWRVGNTVLISGLGALLFAFSCHDAMKPIFSSDMVLVPLYGVVIVTAAGCGGSLSRVLSLPVLVLLGEASYAVYILHLPLAFWGARLRRILPAVEDSTYFVLYSIALLALSIGVYELLEKPMRGAILDWFKQRWSKRAVVEATD